MLKIHKTISLLMENCSHPFAAGDGDGKIVMVNEAFCNFLGYTRAELENMIWPRDITSFKKRQYQIEMFEKQLTTGKPMRFTSEYNHKHGRQIPVEVLVHSLEDTAEKELYQFTLVTDLSADMKDIRNEKILEEITKEQLNLLEDFTRALTDTSAIIDEDGKIIRLLGESGTEQLYKKTIDLVFPDLPATHLSDKLALVLQENTHHSFEVEISIDGRSAVKKVTVSPMRYCSKNKRTVALHVQDITPIRAAEDRRRLAVQIYHRSIFFNDLLSTDHSQEYIETKLDGYGITAKADYCCYIIQIARNRHMKKECLAEDEPRIEAVTQGSVIIWLHAKEVGWVWKRKKYIVLLVPIHQGNVSKEQQIEFANRLKRDIEARFAFIMAKIGISVSVGSSNLAHDLKNLYQRAERALCLCIFSSSHHIIHHADMGLDEVACQLRHDNTTLTLVQKTIGRLFDYDKVHESNLLDTLERIIEDGSLRTAAQKLYVHPNTVNWRKKRIEELLGLSLDVFETRALLSLYIKIWKFQFPGQSK